MSNMNVDTLPRKNLLLFCFVFLFFFFHLIERFLSIWQCLSIRFLSGFVLITNSTDKHWHLCSQCSTPISPLATTPPISPHHLLPLTQLYLASEGNALALVLLPWDGKAQ